MHNTIIINFLKNSSTAQVIKKENEVSIDTKANLFGQLVDNANNKKLKLEIKKLNRDHSFDGYPFIMSNKDNKLVINFEDTNDEYYEQFNKIYLEKKIKKENRLKKIKVFTSRVAATVLITATIGGLAYMASEAYDKELENTSQSNKEYVQWLEDETIKNDKEYRQMLSEQYVENGKNESSVIKR